MAHETVLAIRSKDRVRSEKDPGGAGLKRCNRSRGFSVKIARHIKTHDNYRFLRGLICKKLRSLAMVAGAHY
jgi:hypothetical protein